VTEGEASNAIADPPEDSVGVRSLTWSFFAVHCALPILIGGLIYIFWRDESLLMFEWAEAIGLTQWVVVAREAMGPYGSWVPEWVMFSVPDGAWVYAGTAFFGRLWRDGPMWAHVGWTGIAAALAIGGELGQITGLVPGTFDWVDLVCYAVAGCIAYWFAAIR